MVAEVRVAGETLRLLPDAAVHWPARATLLIADPHFGKDDRFRREGLALPRGPTVTDLQRLTRLVETNAIRRVVVLGDFLHSRQHEGDDFPRQFALWLAHHASLEIDVVAGNHDRHAKPRDSASPRVRWHATPLHEDPFVLAHEPHGDDRGMVLAGHVHPVFRDSRLFGSRGLRAFWLRRECLVLPAFGEFTGGFSVRPGPGERLYVATPEGVLPLA